MVRSIARSALLALPVCVVLLLFSAVPALADGVPVVTIGAPSGVSYASVHLSGTVDPVGGPSTTSYQFEYSTEPEFLGWTPAGEPKSAGAGSGPVVVEEDVSGLAANTTYDVRLVATNEEGAQEAATEAPYPTFTTLEVPVPTITIAAASAVTGTSAHFSGTVNPNAPGSAPGQDPAFTTVWHFECTPGCPGVEGGEIEGDNTPHEVTADAAGLQPDVSYQVSLVASNLGGSASAGPEAFSTPATPPSIDSETASTVTSAAATLEAQVNPDNEETSFAFEYSTDETLAGATTVAGETPLPGEFGDQTATVPRLEGLTPGTTYYYRVTADNGTPPASNGAIQSFTTVPTPNTDEASALTPTTARLNGHLSLNSVDTTYHFVYKLAGETPECTDETTTPEEDAGTGSAEAEQTANITGLLPNTEYIVCFTTANAFGTEQGPPMTFTTPAAEPTVESTSATEVSADAATLDAQINPNGAATTYHFEYGTTTSYGQSTPESLSIGADDTGHPATTHIQGLTPVTTYHYRIVAHNPLGTVPGPDETLTTQAATTTTGPLDGRQYELVSPPNKHGTEVAAIHGFASGGVVQVAADGTRATYLTPEPPTQEAPGNPGGVQNFAVRGPDGWSSRMIVTPHNAMTELTVGDGTEYRAFSSDLSVGLAQPRGTTPLTPDAPTKSRTLYLHNDIDNSFRALIDADEAPTEPNGIELARFVGASPDLSHIASTFDVLSEWSNGQNQPLGLLPNGEPASSPTLGDSQGENTRGAVSTNGANTIWTDSAVTGRALYDTDLRSGVTVQVDAAQEGPESGSGSFSLGADNASKAFFLDNARLTEDSTAAGIGQNGEDLYEFDATTHKLTDLSVVAGGARVLGVVGASESGTYVYFVAEGALAAGAHPGKCPSFFAEGHPVVASGCNLYAEHEGAGGWEPPKFIASLANRDMEDWGAGGLPEEATARVSPDGRYLAFMSVGSLTGYDNRDAVSGERDTEAFVYDAAAGRLSCASCNPSGAQPVGEPDENASMDPTHALAARWLAGMLPSYTPFANDRAWYQPRFLSDSGRLFFDSSDALVAADTNGREDVYEYEPAGVGSCEEDEGTSDGGSAYVPSEHGCVALISSGTSGSDSTLLDASENGDDVFFRTRDRLVREDTDDVFDLYDAHVCSAQVPCFPVAAVPPPACSSGDACKPAASSQPGVFGAPPSATFNGAGNAAPQAVKATPKPTGAQFLARALKACRKKHNKPRRASCERAARKKHAVKTSKSSRSR